MIGHTTDRHSLMCICVEDIVKYSTFCSKLSKDLGNSCEIFEIVWKNAVLLCDNNRFIVIVCYMPSVL